MSLSSVLHDRLTGYSGLSALVSTRVYPVMLPQNATLPALSWSRISAQRISAMGADTGLARARIQIDCWASTHTAVRGVAEQVRAALQRWTNSSGTVIQDVYILSEVDLYEPDTQTHHVALDFDVVYGE